MALAAEEQIKQEIAKLSHVLRVLDGAGGRQAKAAKRDRPRRRLSEAGRKRIAAAQRARWAKLQPRRSKKHLAGVMPEKIGMDRSCIADVERGKRNISILNLDLIAKGFKLSLSRLLSGL